MSVEGPERLPVRQRPHRRVGTAVPRRVCHYLAQTPRFHLRVTFDRPVAGPIAAGRGRHVGFGLSETRLPPDAVRAMPVYDLSAFFADLEATLTALRTKL
jgi:hypothetical protein